jgi:hypothetical protein
MTRSRFPIFIALVLTLAVGCDGGDGDGDGGGKTADTDVATEPADSTHATVTLASGTESVPPGEGRLLAEFTVEEPGMQEVKVEWGTDPETMEVQFRHVASGSRETVVSGSPAYVHTRVNDDLVNQGHGRWFQAISDGTAEVEFRVSFTPD